MILNLVTLVLLNETMIFCLIAALYLASFIIKNNILYLTHLAGFLAPALGNDPSWLLCYRASTHGWGVNEFHTRCDGKRNTVTIIQVSQYIFGGYTDIPWGK